MAYILNYYSNFTNRITENITVEIYRKDVSPPGGTAIELICTYLNKKFINGQGDRFDTIIASELTFGVFIPVSSSVEFDDIIVNQSDEWKVIVKNDSQIDFIGFLVPSECKAAFRDKPYDLEFTATDCLGYLKDVALTTIDDTSFELENKWFLIYYLIGALKKTLLDLDIWIYCNIYEASMPDRNANSQSDMFNKAMISYQTFMSNPTTFVSCWDAIEILLKQGFNLFQWNGKWVVMRCGEMQGVPGPQMWRTEYNWAGVILGATLQTDSPARVAKQKILHPINADQEILSRLANKSAKASFMYVPWPDLPKNSKFERGTLFEQGNVDASTTYKKYTIDNWFYGYTNPSSPSTFPPLGIQATSDLAYRYSTFDIYNVERSREIILERNGGAAGHRFLRPEPMPVNADDKIQVTLEFKSSQGGTGQKRYLLIALEGDSGTSYRLTHAGGAVPNDGIGVLVWEQTGAMRFLSKNYQSGENFNTYASFNLDVPPFPESGDCYVMMVNFDPAIGVSVFYKNFSISYRPYVAGGYQSVKGDYWFTEQNTNYRDIIDEEVSISDAETKVLKGTIFRPDGITPTTRTWHRFNVPENRAYKELVNIAQYNAFYRRMWEISGTFGGTMFHPSNNETIRYPLGFHQHFYFPDSSKLNGVTFQLVPPLEVDYVQGQIRANFVECRADGMNDGNQLGDTHEFKFIF